MKSAHAKRWMTALVALPVVLFLIGKGGQLPLALLVALASALALFEYYCLTLPDKPGALKVSGIILGLAIVGSFYTAGLSAIPVLFLVAFSGSAAMCLAAFGARSSAVESFHRQISGFIYIPFMLGHVILIRDWPSGVTWTFFLVAVVFAGDTAAFYVGTAVGRRKLAPRISPGKTVEGALGGLAASLLIGILFKMLFLQEYGWLDLLLLAVLLGALGQAGDLFESVLKRSADLKDSGTIMPGHGGLLDRIDGLIFAAPGLYYLRTYLL